MRIDVAALLFAAGLATGLLCAWGAVKPRMEEMRSDYEATKAVADYFAAGLINGGLADLCYRNGVAGIWLREECDPK